MKIITVKMASDVAALDGVSIASIPPGVYAGIQSGCVVVIPAAPGITVARHASGIGWQRNGAAFVVELDDGIRGTDEVTVYVDRAGGVAIMPRAPSGWDKIDGDKS